MDSLGLCEHLECLVTDNGWRTRSWAYSRVYLRHTKFSATKKFSGRCKIAIKNIFVFCSWRRHFEKLRLCMVILKFLLDEGKRQEYFWYFRQNFIIQHVDCICITFGICCTCVFIAVSNDIYVKLSRYYASIFGAEIEVWPKFMVRISWVRCNRLEAPCINRKQQ